MSDHDKSKPGPESELPAAASELNNLLQIMAGTVTLLENMWAGDPAAARYFKMLHLTMERASDVTSRLTDLAGGTSSKILLHPAFARAIEPVAERTRCILVVDDEPMALVLTRQVLREAGWEVVTAQSGLECLELVRAQPGRFDLVVLDLTMPEMDGEETFQRLRDLDPNVRVVLNTGFIEQHRLERMMAAGLAGFLRRPYAPDEVVAQIRAILDRRPA